MTHRMRKSPTWMSWQAMVQRCTNVNHADYPAYGGRGVTVHPGWRTLEGFIADMGLRPDGTSVDRYPNRAGNYEPGNCRWATPAEQRANQDPYPLQRRNKSGVAGVRWDQATRRWEAKHPSRKPVYTRDFFEACCYRKSAEAKTKF